MFEINFIKLILSILIDVGCSPIMINLMNAYIEPIKLVYDSFKKKRESDWYRLNHNSQVCYMEAVFNDRFDNALRRIYITDGNRYNRIYIYRTIEEQPKYLGTKYLHNRTDYADTGVDFIVHAPAAIEATTNLFEFKALVDEYKLASKRYTIVYE